MTRTYGGKELAKVLIYYGIVEEITTTEFNILCPFHDDINPSMRICLDDGTFFCFGCEAKGNALDFVMKAHPELNDLQACCLLEQILHSDKIEKLQIKVKRKRKKQSKQALIEAKDYYYGLKTTDWNKADSRDEKQIIEYMKKR